jgi:DnaJ-class molecular chaperone
MVDNFYEILGVAHNATQSEIEHAYRNLSARWHPGVTQGSQEAKQRLNQAEEAFAVLQESRSRSLYDRALAFFREKSDNSTKKRSDGWGTARRTFAGARSDPGVRTDSSGLDPA